MRGHSGSPLRCEAIKMSNGGALKPPWPVVCAKCAFLHLPRVTVTLNKSSQSLQAQWDTVFLLCFPLRQGPSSMLKNLIEHDNLNQLFVMGCCWAYVYSLCGCGVYQRTRQILLQLVPVSSAGQSQVHHLLSALFACGTLFCDSLPTQFFCAYLLCQPTSMYKLAANGTCTFVSHTLWREQCSLLRFFSCSNTCSLRLPYTLSFSSHFTPNSTGLVSWSQFCLLNSIDVLETQKSYKNKSYRAVALPVNQAARPFWKWRNLCRRPNSFLVQTKKYASPPPSLPHTAARAPSQLCVGEKALAIAAW